MGSRITEIASSETRIQEFASGKESDTCKGTYELTNKSRDAKETSPTWHWQNETWRSASE